MTLLTDGFPKSKRGTLLHDGSLGWERAHAFDYMTIRSKLGAQIEWNEDGTLKLKDDYVPVTTRERLRAEAAIQELHDRLDAIYEALYSGEQSKDGLYCGTPSSRRPVGLWPSPRGTWPTTTSMPSRERMSLGKVPSDTRKNSNRQKC